MASPQAPRFRDHFPVELPAPGSLILGAFPSTGHALLLAAARDWLERREYAPPSLGFHGHRELVIGVKNSDNLDAVNRLLSSLSEYIHTLLRDPESKLTFQATLFFSTLDYSKIRICDAVVEELRAFGVYGFTNSHLLVQVNKPKYDTNPHFTGARYEYDNWTRRLTGGVFTITAFLRPEVRRLVALLDVVWTVYAIDLFESRGPTSFAQLVDQLRGPSNLEGDMSLHSLGLVRHNTGQLDGRLVLTVSIWQSDADLTQPPWPNVTTVEGRYEQDASKSAPIQPNSVLLTDLSLRAALIREMRQMRPHQAIEIKVSRNALTSEERRAVWIRDDAARRRLVQHLITIPGVLIDMSREPMRPWKGVRFFHGTDYKELQGAPHSPETTCKLSWNVLPNGQQLTAFTTPYITKAFNYGGLSFTHVFTYRLKRDGSQLRMLDLRNDYDFSSHKTPIDVFRKISELSGIRHITTRNRVPQAIQLYQLFRDTGIDGMILNTDLEWIWFDPPSVLEWERPPPGTMLERLFNDRGDTRSVVHASILKENIEAITVPKLHALLKEPHIAMTKRVVRVGDLPYARWTLDRNIQPYANQYLLQHAQDVSPAPVWTPLQDIKHNEKIQLYRVDMADLWRAFAPLHDPRRFADLYMGATITEGMFNSMLPYRILLEVIKQFNDRVERLRYDLYPKLRPMARELARLVDEFIPVYAEQPPHPDKEKNIATIKNLMQVIGDPDHPVTLLAIPPLRNVFTDVAQHCGPELLRKTQSLMAEWADAVKQFDMAGSLCLAVRLPNGYHQLVPPLQTDAESLMPSYKDHPASHALPPALKPAGRRVTATLRGFTDRPAVQPIDERESKKMKVGARARVFV
jgi:hypothetical protein